MRGLRQFDFEVRNDYHYLKFGRQALSVGGEAETSTTRIHTVSIVFFEGLGSWLTFLGGGTDEILEEPGIDMGRHYLSNFGRTSNPRRCESPGDTVRMQLLRYL